MSESKFTREDLESLGSLLYNNLKPYLDMRFAANRAQTMITTMSYDNELVIQIKNPHFKKQIGVSGGEDQIINAVINAAVISWKIQNITRFSVEMY